MATSPLEELRQAQEMPEFKIWRHCWVRGKRHDWSGKHPEPGWATKQCLSCGRIVVCGM